MNIIGLPTYIVLFMIVFLTVTGLSITLYINLKIATEMNKPDTFRFKRFDNKRLFQIVEAVKDFLTPIMVSGWHSTFQFLH